MVNCKLHGFALFVKDDTLCDSNLEALWHVSSNGLSFPVVHYACLIEAANDLVEVFLVWGWFSDGGYNVTSIQHLLHNPQCLDSCLVYVSWYRVVICRTVNVRRQLLQQELNRKGGNWKLSSQNCKLLPSLCVCRRFLNSNIYKMVFWEVRIKKLRGDSWKSDVGLDDVFQLF